MVKGDPKVGSCFSSPGEQPAWITGADQKVLFKIELMDYKICLNILRGHVNN
jgi:hypothetical protein